MYIKLLILICCISTGLQAVEDNSEKLIAVLNDFEQPMQHKMRSITYWRWSKEQLAQADTYSQLSIVPEGVDGSKCLKAVISPDLPWGNGDKYSLLSLSNKHFPPETDAIRMKIKVKSGTAQLRLGGPTIYLGNSDAETQQVTLDVSSQEWQEVTFSLNHDLMRNYRRSGYSTGAARIYYTRWAQEPCFIWILNGMHGEFLIDDIELIARGEGKPFPVFKESEVKKIKPLIDFHQDDQIKKVTSLLMADNQISAFAESWSRDGKSKYFPPNIELKQDAGGNYLRMQAEFLEEILCSPILCQGSEQGNALSYHIRANKPGSQEAVAGYEWNLSLEFVVFIGPQEFDWKRFSAPEEMRKGPGPGFEHNISYRTIAGLKDLSFAMYHARRFVKMDEWSQIIIPFADFTCIYGQGDYEDCLTGHKDLTTGKDIMAVTILGTYPRAGRGETSIDIQTITQVAVPGTVQELRSFWQMPDPQQYKIHRDTKASYGGVGTMVKK